MKRVKKDYIICKIPLKDQTCKFLELQKEKKGRRGELI